MASKRRKRAGRADLELPTELVESRIHVIRGEKVLLDEVLAELYAVRTKALLQAVRRNRDRFPEDFAFRLTKQEFTDLRSQFVGLRENLWVGVTS